MSTDSYIMINLEFGTKLLTRILDEGGVHAWNGFLDNLFTRNEVAGSWTDGETPPLVDVGFDFSDLQAPARNLDEIDLWLCQLDGANFDRTSLRGAKIGCCPNASFRYASLSGARFGEVSGCDFTGAELDGIVLEDMTFDPLRPPLGLPQELLTLCTSVRSKKWADFDDDPGEIPYYVPDTIDCHASIHFIPKKG